MHSYNYKVRGNIVLRAYKHNTENNNSMINRWISLRGHEYKTVNKTAMQHIHALKARAMY